MNISSRPELIGLAGTFASGKDLIARHLSEHYGYAHASTSEVVRNLAMKERGSVERPVLYQVAEHYRKTHGAEIFVKMALGSLRPTVVTGLRSLGEAKAIKRAGGIIVFIDAPLNVRYERMKARDRDNEVSISLEEFKKREQSEWHIGDKDEDFNLKGIKEIADYVFDSSPPKPEMLADVLSGLKII